MPNRQYYPRNMGFRGPRGEHAREFMITGRDRVGVLAEVATAFASRNVSLTRVSAYELHGGDGFFFNLYADFSKTSVSPEDITRELHTIEGVERQSKPRTFPEGSSTGFYSPR